MNSLWSETCWNTFKYFIILIVSTYYILCISWIINCLINIIFFRIMTPSSLVIRSKRFGGNYLLHLHGILSTCYSNTLVYSSWNVMAHGDAQEWKWRGNWRMDWVASTLHTTSEHGVSSITTDDAHTSAASSRLNWRLCWFKWTRPIRRKTKSGFCACDITFQTGLST